MSFSSKKDVAKSVARFPQAQDLQWQDADSGGSNSKNRVAKADGCIRANDDASCIGFFNSWFGFRPLNWI